MVTLIPLLGSSLLLLFVLCPASLGCTTGGIFALLGRKILGPSFPAFSPKLGEIIADVLI
jgi:hypothetical protein